MFGTVVVDGNWISHRAYAVGGRDGCKAAVLQTVIGLQRTWHPAEIVIVWDRYGAAGWRRARLPDYKTGRPAPLPEFLQLLVELRATPALLGLGVTHAMPAEERDGTFGEADDAAFTLVEESLDPVMLVSADKDWLQMLVPGAAVSVLRETSQGAELHEPSNVQALTGLSAAGWHSYLCLAGDTADRVPGLARVGNQRARDIISATSQNVVCRILAGHLPDVLRRLDAAAPGLTRYLVGCEELLALMDDLVRLRECALVRSFGAFDLGVALPAIEALAGRHLAEQAARAWDEEL
jgi:5'-3' exonuclease